MGARRLARTLLMAWSLAASNSESTYDATRRRSEGASRANPDWRLAPARRKLVQVRAGLS